MSDSSCVTTSVVKFRWTITTLVVKWFHEHGPRDPVRDPIRRVVAVRIGNRELRAQTGAAGERRFDRNARVRSAAFPDLGPAREGNGAPPSGDPCGIPAGDGNSCASGFGGTRASRGANGSICVRSSSAQAPQLAMDHLAASDRSFGRAFKNRAGYVDDTAMVRLVVRSR